jgi:ABC-type bacteriocin/lantibiotic exporter with double-glycine peptidase domain
MAFELPYYRQENDYSCGPATLQMVFEYFNIVESQAEIAARGNTSEDSGLAEKDLVRLVREAGFFCYRNSSATFHHIAHFLQLEIPVIVHYIEPSDNEGHYAVVVSINQTHITLNDPWNGEGFTLDLHEFDQRWCDEESEDGKWIMVIAPDKSVIGTIEEPIQSKA